MTVKLTLSVDEAIVKKAKAYAKRRGMSVSKIFSESIAEKVTEEKRDKQKETTDKYAVILEDIMPKKKFVIPEEWKGLSDKQIIAHERELYNKRKGK